MDGHVLGSFHIFLHLIPLLNITFFSLYFYGRLKPPHWSTNTADGVEIWTQASWTVSTSLMIQTKCPDLAGIQKSKQECWSRQTSARITLQGGKRAVLLPCPGFHLQSQACTLAAKGKLQSELFFTHANPLLLEQHLTFCPEIRSTCRCHQPPVHLCSGWTLSYPAAERRMRTYMCTVRIQLSQLTRKHWMELPLPPEVVFIFFSPSGGQCWGLIFIWTFREHSMLCQDLVWILNSEKLRVYHETGKIQLHAERSAWDGG